MYGYAGFGASHVFSTVHSFENEQKFHLETILCNAFDWIERDLTNVLDWQHVGDSGNDYIRIFMQQLGLYQTTNVNFHSGDLLQHSIWSLLFAEYIMKTSGLNHPVITDDQKKAIAFAAFIHDIGKMAPQQTTEVFPNNKLKKFIYFDIPTHPKIGSDYIQNGIPVYNPDDLTNTGTIDIDQLFTVFNINIAYKDFVRLAILYHWDFGNALKRFNSTQRLYANDIGRAYLQTLKDVAYGISEDNFRFAVYMLLVVSIADINATQPYGKDRIIQNPAQLNKVSSYFPFITNMPKQYRGGNVVEISSLNTIGIQFANHILNLIPEFYKS